MPLDFLKFLSRVTHNPRIYVPVRYQADAKSPSKMSCWPCSTPHSIVRLSSQSCVQGPCSPCEYRRRPSEVHAERMSELVGTAFNSGRGEFLTIHLVEGP